MAVAVKTTSELLTYEDYLAEGEIRARYDILDGIREYMTNPTRRHQRIALSIAEILRRYEQRSQNGQVIIAPCDVLITRTPLRTRQPGVLFISNERLAQNGSQDDPAPLSPAPEWVVEILSPSDTPRVLDGKIADYCRVDVRECWIVRTGDTAVDVLRLTSQGATVVASYAAHETLTSLVFPDLSVPVADLFNA